MAKKAKSIFALKHNVSLDFFLKSELFHGFELPEYFKIVNVLNAEAVSAGEISFGNCLTNVLPDELQDLDLDFFSVSLEHRRNY